ncbi:cysteine desulfurase family protein [Marinilactibacillus psychrotolerans]|uniref:Cysteine desulfurase n=1 Tax=Marinilactibacillus psychrotolerans TaxID=191770 RepID=A0AAV3WNW1_9LACT|nr:cysteine desulfurase family protein [Marinilactibacillus psychrotolerans]GEL66103.1 aminotransferase V [Marinilactibacillus psychrotolerans]GEQ34612.1 cysteine desulfurase [Marinilactibacillus psychrotolerans]SDB97838.1 cysteine desulfurase [Marinilactibacillus psychrotolerans]
MIYLDNSATTKIDSSVLETFNRVNKLYFGNPSSLHELGETTTGLLTQSRRLIAETVGVQSEEIFFTSGGTEGDNWVVKGTALEKIHFGKHLITSEIEHPAVLESIKQLENLGWEVTYLPVDSRGIISVENLKRALREDTVLVSVMAVNNETGSIQPVEKIGEILKDYPSIHFHVDAVQAVGKIDLKLGEQSRIDMAVFSGHKFHGPKGTGFVYVKKGRKLAPLLSGGGQEAGRRSGTENVPGIVAMAKALKITSEKQIKTQSKLTIELEKYLDKKKNIEIFSPKHRAPHILCFGIKGIKGEVLVHALEKKGVFVSTTSACSSKKKTESSTLLAMGIPKITAETAIRVSLSEENTQEELEKFIKIFDEIYHSFKVIL